MVNCKKSKEGHGKEVVILEKTEQKKSRKRNMSLKILEKKARSLVGLISKKADVAFEGLVKVSAPFFAKINIICFLLCANYFSIVCNF